MGPWAQMQALLNTNHNSSVATRVSQSHKAIGHIMLLLVNLWNNSCASPKAFFFFQKVIHKLKWLFFFHSGIQTKSNP